MISIEAKKKELEKYGLSIEDFTADERSKWNTGEIAVWPENWRSFQLFNTLETQWRYSEGYRTGFDYAVLPEVWRRLKIPVSERDDLFADLQHMEIAALKQLQENEKTKTNT